jgi:hypothetical protein
MKRRKKKKKCKCSAFLFTSGAMAERPGKEGGPYTARERGRVLQFGLMFRSTFLKEVDERIFVSMGR